jgi:uncharacterized protein
MNTKENLAAVKSAYEAFKRGDIPSVLEMLTEDVHWISPGQKEVVPYVGQFKGKAAVATFFADLASSEDVLAFEPHEFVSEGDVVVACIFYRARVKTTGRIYEGEGVHMFRFYKGKIVSFREFLDTAVVAAAYTR